MYHAQSSNGRSFMLHSHHYTPTSCQNNSSPIMSDGNHIASPRGPASDHSSATPISPPPEDTLANSANGRSLPPPVEISHSHLRENAQRRVSVRREGVESRNSQGEYFCDHVDCLVKKPTFLRRCEWSKHMDKHDRPYRCGEPGCEKLLGFTYSGGLLRHEREVHRKHGGPRKPLTCPFESCKRSAGSAGFTRLENLNEHLRRVHKRNPTVSGRSPVVTTATIASTTRTTSAGAEYVRIEPSVTTELSSLRQERDLHHHQAELAANVARRKRKHLTDASFEQATWVHPQPNSSFRGETAEELQGEVKRLRRENSDIMEELAHLKGLVMKSLYR